MTPRQKQKEKHKKQGRGRHQKKKKIRGPDKGTGKDANHCGKAAARGGRQPGEDCSGKAVAHRRRRARGSHAVADHHRAPHLPAKRGGGRTARGWKGESWPPSPPAGAHASRRRVGELHREGRRPHRASSATRGSAGRVVPATARDRRRAHRALDWRGGWARCKSCGYTHAWRTKYGLCTEST